MTERELFTAALHQPGPAARVAFLDAACGGDRGLRGRVEALLREYEQLGSFLERPAAAPAETAVGGPPPADAPTTPAALNDPPPAPGAVLGPYKLLEVIGQGGMGSVFLAEQQHPVRRQVAVKLIRPGMDSRQVVARFEAERQALALMDHPNIAKVHDAGATETGRP